VNCNIHYQKKIRDFFYILILRNWDSKVMFLVVSNEPVYNMRKHMYPLI